MGGSKVLRSSGPWSLPSPQVITGPVNLTVPKYLLFGLVFRRLLSRALRGALQHILARHPGVATAAQRQHAADQYGGNDYENNDGFEHGRTPQDITLIRPSCATLATKRPSRANMLPRVKPRAPEALGLSMA